MFAYTPLPVWASVSTTSPRAALWTVTVAPLTLAPSPSLTVTEKAVSGAVAETVTVTLLVTSNVDDPEPARL